MTPVLWLAALIPAFPRQPHVLTLIPQVCAQKQVLQFAIADNNADATWLVSAAYLR